MVSQWLTGQRLLLLRRVLLLLLLCLGCLGCNTASMQNENMSKAVSATMKRVDTNARRLACRQDVHRWLQRPPMPMAFKRLSLQAPLPQHRQH
jgi:hypothetical protein